MFERYTERARRVLFFARYECTELGSSIIETEHVLLGLLRDGSGLAGRILSTSPLSADRLRTELLRRIGPPQAKIAPSVEIPFGPHIKRALLYTVEEADRLQHSYIASEHLLLGLLREHGSIAAQVLEAEGLRADVVREEARAQLTDRRLVTGDPLALDRIIDGVKGLIDELIAEFHTPTGTVERKQLLVEQIHALLDSLRDPTDSEPI
jgi:ATP-dependent Clp protease ATP-binding subunit ClpC